MKYSNAQFFVFTPLCFVFEMLHIISYVYTYDCTQEEGEDINNFRNGNIESFITDNILSIPCGVTTIANQIQNYQSKDTIIEVIIPDSVQIISDNAFEGCTNLETANIPNSVTKMGNWVFLNCRKLSTTNIPTKLEKLYGGAFANCTSLKKITIPSNIQEIGYVMHTEQYLQFKQYGPFTGSGIYEITIENGITAIEDYVFTNCLNLQYIIIPNTVTQIKQFAFSSCTSLTCVQMSSAVEQINENAFYNTKYEGKTDKSQFDEKCEFNPCLVPDNFYIDEYDATFKECQETCNKVWKQQIVDERSVKICLTGKDDCQSVEGYTIQIENQCASKCGDAIGYYYSESSITDNKCVKDCNNGKDGDELIEYVWYIGDSDSICTQETSCSSDSDGQTNGYGKQAGQQCVQYCKDVEYFQKDKDTINTCVEKCSENGKKVWYEDTDNICTSVEKCSAINIEGKTYKLVKGTRNNQCTADCGNNYDGDNPIPFVWYNNDIDNKCSDQTQCGIENQDIAKYSKIIEETKQCVSVCAQTEGYYYKQGATNNVCIKGCQISMDTTTLYNMWYQDGREKICTNEFLCSNEGVIVGEGEDQKVLKFRESQGSYQCVEQCKTNNVWFVYTMNYGIQTYNENMCTEIERCDLHYLTGYEKLDKNQDFQCVEKCLGKDENDNQVEYVYYYESVEMGYMCTPFTKCELHDYPNLQYNQNQECVAKCTSTVNDEKIDLVWYEDEQLGKVCETTQSCNKDDEYLIVNTSQCVTECNGNYDIDETEKKCIINNCKDLNNYYKDQYDANYKECTETCDNVWYYQEIAFTGNNRINAKVCLTTGDCTSLEDKKVQAGNQCIDKCMNSDRYKFIKLNGDQCVDHCQENEFIQEADYKCITSCTKNGDKQLYQYQDGQNDNVMCTEKSCQQISTDENKYYIYEMTDNQIYCTLSCNTDRTGDKPYILISEDQQKCVSECPENYQLVEQTCTLQEQNTSTCPEGQFIYNNNDQVECVQQCPDGYKADDEQKCVEEKQDDNKLQTGQIVGIVIGVVAAVIVIVVAIICIKKCKQNKSQNNEQHMDERVIENA